MDSIPLLITIVVMIISMVELIINSIPDKTKKDGDSMFPHLPYSKVRTLLIVTICAFVGSISIFVGIYMFIQDGAYAFFDKKTDLNSAIYSEETVEAGEYVSVRFRVVGEAFHPEGSKGTYYPIVIYDEKSDPKDYRVYSIHVNDSDVSLMDKYSMESLEALEQGESMEEYPILEYSGRLMILEKFESAYEQAVDASGITGKDYIVDNYSVDTLFSREKTRNDLLYWGIIGIVCLVSCVVIVVVWKKRMPDFE